MTVPSTHSLPRPYDVWLAPAAVSSRPESSCDASDRAHVYGVAGSWTVPTTTIGGAPGAWIGPTLPCGGDGPERARQSEPHRRRAEVRGATRSTRAASCLHRRDRCGRGRIDAADRVERRRSRWSTSRRSCGRCTRRRARASCRRRPRPACASAARERRRSRPRPNTARSPTPMSSSPGPSVRCSPSTVPGIDSCAIVRDEVVVAPRPGRRRARTRTTWSVRQYAKNASRSASKLLAWSMVVSAYDTARGRPRRRAPSPARASGTGPRTPRRGTCRTRSRRR